MTISDRFFDTPDELAWGFLTGFFSTLYFGWWSILYGILCAIAWCLGGMYGHSKRVFLVPAIILYQYLPMGFSWFLVAYYIATASTLSCGYGIPTPRIYNLGKPYHFFDKTLFSDAGSAIGRFWYTKHNGNEDKANFHTRWTIAILLILSFAPLAMHVDKINYDKEMDEYERVDRAGQLGV